VTFDWAAAVAATLLDRPVLIRGYRSPGPDEALRDLGTVVNLLPLGVRSTMNVGTWTRNREPGTHLAFAPKRALAAPEAFEHLEWQTMPDMSSRSEAARTYFGVLMRVYAAHGNSAAYTAKGSTRQAKSVNSTPWGPRNGPRGSRGIWTGS
jgi:hypothetical protein